MMLRLHDEFPGYGWNANKGYPTATHRAAIRELGITPYHRQSFRLTNDQLSLWDTLPTLTHFRHHTQTIPRI